jgi:serine/threonine-protein kinase RsbW
MNRQREIRLESSLSEMFRVEQFVEEISDEHMLYGSYFGNIMMAVTEAVENAIVHANREDKAKQVRIKAELTKEGLWITVTDEGIGFNYREYLQKQADAGFTSEKTGLLVVQKLCDELNFSRDGRSLRMLFKINGIDEQIFIRREAFMQEFFKVYQKLSI